MTPFTVLAFFGPFGFSELVIIVGAALMIFGGRRPEVAMRAAAQVMRARKVVTRMWREAGLEQELRRVQWEIEREMPRDTDFDVSDQASRTLAAPRTPGAATAAAPAVAADPHADDHRDEHGDDHAGEAAGELARLDPAIGFGAPAGTVAVSPPVLAREPDPAPRPPDLPPRDAEGGAPAAPGPAAP